MGKEGQEFGLGTEKRQGQAGRKTFGRSTMPMELNSALDPTQMAVEIKAAAAKSGAKMSDADVALAAEKSIRAMMLIKDLSGAWAFGCQS